MKLFSKERPTKRVPLPFHLAVSISLFAVGLLFFLCYNQPEYSSYGDGDSLIYTLPAFIFLTVGPFVDILFHFVLPSKSEKVGIAVLRLVPVILEVMGVVAGAVAYFRHSNETNSVIVILHCVITALAVIPLVYSAYVLFKPLLASDEEKKEETNPENEAIKAGNESALSLGVVFLYLLASSLCPIAAAWTSGYSPAGPSFILQDVVAAIYVILIVGLYVLSRVSSLSKYRAKFSLIGSLIAFVASIVAIIAVVVEYDNAYAHSGGITYRAFYWILGANILSAIFAFFIVIFQLYLQYPDKFGFLRHFKEPAEGLEEEAPPAKDEPASPSESKNE